MISIIAGKYRGRKLFDMKDIHVRPTQAKVRKSVFQILEPFTNLEVLDLFAGVGTLGFEALSRGARNVVFVEKNRRAVKVLEKNCTLFTDANKEVFSTDAYQFLARYRERKFDIIFADPPYQDSDYPKVKEHILPHLKPGGIFCMEMKKADIEEKSVRIKHYGSTQVVFWRAEA